MACSGFDAIYMKSFITCLFVNQRVCIPVFETSRSPFCFRFVKNVQAASFAMSFSLSPETNIMNFNLRPWQATDIASLVRYANNWQIAKNMTDKFPHPYTEDAGRAFIAFATSEKPVRIFAIDVDGEAVGGIGIHPQDDIHQMNAELGYWLAEPFWGRGIVSNAIRQMVDFAFATYRINRVFARPFGTNLASQRVLQKNGFALEGRFKNVLLKKGEYFDELVYAIRREEWKA